MKNSAIVDFHRIGIYGIGLLGGSLGMALKALHPDAAIIGIGRSPERLEEAKRLGAVDSYTCEPGKIDPPLDLLVICTPVRMVPGHLEQTLASMNPGAVATDVGSTKADVVRRCEEIAGNRIRFIGSHPIAGSHKTGVGAAQKDLFENKVCVVTETERTDPAALEAVCELWRSIGMRVTRLTPEIHDFLLARSSHLPHLAASALCHVIQKAGPEIEPVLGTGFRDATRIAAGDPGMWLDICMENQKEILDSLASLRDVLDDIRRWLETGDEKAIYAFLQQAQDWKHSLVE
ncbi:MAG: prephenate dehydrogenase/arogenate dehydrogenase family protein [Candidatus Omnitrophota bacterium]